MSNKKKYITSDKRLDLLFDASAPYHQIDLWSDKELHFENLQGYENLYSMRLKDKYRLEMRIK